MTIKHIEEYHCDRCKRIFQQRESEYGVTRTMDIGWFEYQNGSGSKDSSHDARWENLDYNLCPDCTKAFRAWWREGSNDST